jgi:hypothetical protein
MFARNIKSRKTYIDDEKSKKQTLINAGVGKSIFSIASPRYEHKRVNEDLS